MGQPSRDAVVELHHACVHSLRFAIGAPLGYPDAPAPLPDDNPPPALFQRVQAVSPPPGRDGQDWYSGMTLDDEPFRPDAGTGRLTEVKIGEGIAALDVPDPATVVLDEVIAVDRQTRTMSFPGPDEGRYLLSIGYWSIIPPGEKSIEKDVLYYGEYDLTWSRPPADTWVALSLDAFWPPERDSADLLIPLGDCDANCPPPA